MKKAHAYAYGGCVIQDMGYYPFGSKYFSDLVHYVRSGDFVEALLASAQDLDELAFALGALAHYAADNNGHPIAVNRAVPIEYPKLRAQYGSVVTYAENPAAHLKVEFGFDVAQVAQGNYAPEDYHDFIGFQVSKELLERAFLATYGLELKDQFVSLDLALGTYRRTVGTIIPDATKIAWSLKRKEIVQARPGMTKRKFLYNLKGSSYEKEWGTQYTHPGAFARFMAFVFRIVPKVGPFKSVNFKAPTPQTEKLFMQNYYALIDNLVKDGGRARCAVRIPRYSAVIECVPIASLDVVSVGDDSRLTRLCLSEIVPSLKPTLPVGAGPADVTVAVKVTGCL